MLNEAAHKAPGGGQRGRATRRLEAISSGSALPSMLTLASFWAAETHEVWQPGMPVLLAALAIGQMGVHRRVLLAHFERARTSTNNFLALAFGIFVVGLVVFGSMIIMANLNANMRCRWTG